VFAAAPAGAIMGRPGFLTMFRRRILLAALVTAALAAAGCGATAATTPTTLTTTTAQTTTRPTHRQRVRDRIRRRNRARRGDASAPPRPATGTAAAALARLAVKGRAPLTGYSRSQFGDGWSDIAGCDTRDRILRRDLTARTYLDDCRVATGTLADPYTAVRIHYLRGASEVDIDHVVALADAWQKGAQQWTPSKRVAFANDPLELLAVSAHANRAKGDGDAATWLPPNKAFRCTYVARQVAIKTKYTLWVTQAEKDAIARVLATCPGERLPSPGAPIPVTVTRPASTPTAPPRRRTTPRPGGGGTVYANCAAARAAGVTPILRGTPDYAANPHLDRDHDGIACES
jgi:hypothetical protein